MNGAQYGKDTSLDCAKCTKIISKTLYVVFSIAVLAFLVVLFVKGAQDYAKGTLARGALQRSQAFAPWRNQTSFPPERQIRSDIDVVISSPSLEGNPIDPSDILKVRYHAGLQFNRIAKKTIHSLKYTIAPNMNTFC